MSSKEFTKKLIDTKFDKLVEKKGRFSYAPWATAVKQLLLVAPDSTWTFGTPMNLGETVMVSTTVTINNITRPCIMPCYATPRGGGKPTSITNPDSYELNTSYMRCLVKNIAMFGLGIDIYTQDETDEFYMEFEEGPLVAAKRITSFSTVPTAIVVGSRDKGFGRACDMMHAKIQGSVLMKIPNAGHMAAEKNPKEFNVILLSALNHFFATAKL